MPTIDQALQFIMQLKQFSLRQQQVAADSKRADAAADAAEARWKAAEQDALGKRADILFGVMAEQKQAMGTLDPQSPEYQEMQEAFSQNQQHLQGIFGELENVEVSPAGVEARIDQQLQQLAIGRKAAATQQATAETDLQKKQFDLSQDVAAGPEELFARQSTAELEGLEADVRVSAIGKEEFTKRAAAAFPGFFEEELSLTDEARAGQRGGHIPLDVTPEDSPDLFEGTLKPAQKDLDPESFSRTFDKMEAFVGNILQEPWGEDNLGEYIREELGPQFRRFTDEYGDQIGMTQGEGGDTIIDPYVTSAEDVDPELRAKAIAYAKFIERNQKGTTVQPHLRAPRAPTPREVIGLGMQHIAAADAAIEAKAVGRSDVKAVSAGTGAPGIPTRDPAASKASIKAAQASRKEALFIRKQVLDRAFRAATTEVMMTPREADEMIFNLVARAPTITWDEGAQRENTALRDDLVTVLAKLIPKSSNPEMNPRGLLEEGPAEPLFEGPKRGARPKKVEPRRGMLNLGDVEKPKEEVEPGKPMINLPENVDKTDAGRFLRLMKDVELGPKEMTTLLSIIEADLAQKKKKKDITDRIGSLIQGK